MVEEAAQIIDLLLDHLGWAVVHAGDDHLAWSAGQRCDLVVFDAGRCSWVVLQADKL